MNTLELDTLILKHGGHNGPDDGYCIMEAVAYVAGEPWTDSPKCCCPVIAAFMRSWNDGLRTDEERTRLLRPFIPKLVGSKSTPSIKLRRSWMAFDWLIRECAPAFLSLTPRLSPHAAALRSLPELDQSNFDLAVEPCKAATSAATSAAYYAAHSAANAAAYSAANSAAYSAATSAAYSAAYSAATSAAYSAATSAATSAAYSAATSAALQPTVEKLQQSACELVDRMLAVKD